MTLKDNLYSIIGKTDVDGKFSYRISLNPACSIFQAHFPGMPITPGVCVIQAVKELLEDAMCKPLQISGVKNAKFLSPIIPDGTMLSVNLSNIKISDDKISTQSIINDDNGTVYAKISLQTINA